MQGPIGGSVQEPVGSCDPQEWLPIATENNFDGKVGDIGLTLPCTSKNFLFRVCDRHVLFCPHVCVVFQARDPPS